MLMLFLEQAHQRLVVLLILDEFIAPIQWCLLAAICGLWVRIQIPDQELDGLDLLGLDSQMQGCVLQPRGWLVDRVLRCVLRCSICLIWTNELIQSLQISLFTSIPDGYEDVLKQILTIILLRRLQLHIFHFPQL